jgi:hypothetical protein
MGAHRALSSSCPTLNRHSIDADHVLVACNRIERNPMTTRVRRAAAVAACSVLGFTGTHIASAADKASSRSDASLSELPDWSGWWGQGDSPTRSFVSHPPPLTEARRSQLSRRQPGEIGPGLYCRPAAFTGFNGNFVVNFEFLFTPGRVTITNEGGLIRRIFTDGRALPANPAPSNSGTSVGHWEGQTLVIETTGISADAPVARFGPIGRHARIIEHIRLKQADILETEVETIAPDLFTGPDRRTYLSGRVPGKQAPQDANFCNEKDRSYDSRSGKERFDMTPPTDLPAPPAH